MSLPNTYSLNKAYPNPFNSKTSFSYYLPIPSVVSIIIFDIEGKIVKNLTDGYEAAGEHTVTWDASDVSSGVYYCRMSAGSIALTKAVTLIK
ncbi:MAG: T9SS type A sorting domain-containing protein [Veillonellaceae bacterium]|jgi:flagellar hook assembly protein FlgD|nr:T9SS type A sorting domain-containing protein [Veillonellaceae bacterium]